jgi:aminopeptidase N
MLNILFPLIVFSQPYISAAGKSKSTAFPTWAAPGYSWHEDKYDVHFYFINLEVSNQNTFIKGFVTIHAFRVAENIDTFVVELSQKISVDSIFLKGRKQGFFLHENNLLKIVLQEEAKTFAEYNLQIYYHGTAGTEGFYSGISSQTASTWNQKVTYTLSEPFQAMDWFPVKQNLNDKADSVWVFITVDSSLMAGSNGLLKDIKNLEDGKKRFEWKSNYPIAYYLISFSVGDYMDYSFYAPVSPNDSVLVQNFLYDSPGILDKVKSIVDQTGPLLTLFSEKFGMYPFSKEKYGHCMAPLGGGMEHQTMTSISGFDFGIVAHELAHQWFGDYLTCGTWQDIWINEGFASYAEYIAIEGLKTHQEAVKWLAHAHNLSINFPSGSVYLTPEESQNIQRIFNFSLTYKKGGSIIHMLRYEINNDSLFFAILRDYIASYANSTATGEEFKQIVEYQTGQDFDWFFNQWYFGKGYPVFVTNWRQVGDSLIITSSQTSSSGEDNFFRTHMDFRVRYQNGETEDFRVLYEQAESIFRFYTPGE